MPKSERSISESLGVNTVVIDAGHGGKDPGNLGTGRYKTTEKHVALDVALKLGGYINEKFPDVKVIYTRDKDEFIPLKERTNIANKAEADLFISIHCNSAASKSAHGTETFVMGLHKSQANLEVAKKENSAIFLEENYEQVYEGFDPNSPESLIARVLAQKVHRDLSLGLSNNIQKQYTERVARTDRGVKEAGFWVISYTAMPSVLTELGFLSNSAEEDFLNSEKGKTYMASAIFRAFRDYKNDIEGVEIDISDDLPAPSKEKVEPPKEEKPTKKEEKMAEKKAAVADGSDELVYKIQIVSSRKPIPLKPENFKGLKNVGEYAEKGMYKYTVGNLKEYKTAVKMQSKIRSSAYDQAFIIALHNGKRIPVSKALELSK